MSEPAAAPAEEPSIEEILASIRKIISDEPGAEGEAAPLDDMPLPPADNDVTPPPVLAGNIDATVADNNNEDDALDLGAFLDEDTAMNDATPDTAADDWNLEMEDLAASDPAPAAPPATGDDNLISADAAAAATAAMARLTHTTQPKSNQIIGGNPMVTARTMEDVVEDLLRPLLRDWLDQNLPHLVERLVEKELTRMSRRALDE